MQRSTVGHAQVDQFLVGPAPISRAKSKKENITDVNLRKKQKIKTKQNKNETFTERFVKVIKIR